MLPIHVQVVNYDVWVFEVAVAGVAVQWFSVQPEHSDDQPDNSAPQETGLHYELH